MIKKFFILFILLTACKDDQIRELSSLAEEGIVNYTETNASLINTPNSHRIISNQGANGLIIFNTGSTSIPYRAFDLGCPYISPTNCTERMSVDSSGIMSCDDCTDDDITFSHFNTSTTVNGTTYYLVEYNATFNGSSITITNFNN